jgi:hypothetical protein
MEMESTSKEVAPILSFIQDIGKATTACRNDNDQNLSNDYCRLFW